MSDCKLIGKITTVSDSTGPLGELKEITPPEVSVDVLETTVYGPEYWKTFCAGLKDGGSLGLSIYYSPGDASQNRMYRRALADPSLNYDTYTITFPDGKTMILDGVIESVGYETPIDDNIMIPYSIKVSGPITGTLLGP